MAGVMPQQSVRGAADTPPNWIKSPLPHEDMPRPYPVDAAILSRRKHWTSSGRRLACLVTNYKPGGRGCWRCACR